MKNSNDNQQETLMHDISQLLVIRTIWYGGCQYLFSKESWHNAIFVTKYGADSVAKWQSYET